MSEYDETEQVWRGCRNGCLLSVPLWAAILGGGYALARALVEQLRPLLAALGG